MLQFFIRPMFRQVRKSFAVVFFSLLGLTIACFCLSVAQGDAMQEFNTIAGWNEYATLTVDQGGGEFQDMDALADWIDETYGDAVANVLYLGRDSSGIVYIGWQGTQASRWFAMSSGRFFTDEEAGAEVIFMQDDDGASDAETFTLNGRELRIVGRGGFFPFHFQIGISGEAPTQVFSSDNGAGTGRGPVIRILPYRLFSQLFKPVQILIHFDKLDTREAGAAQKAIRERLPEARVFLPNHDPSPILTQKVLRGAREGLLLCLIAGVTILQLMFQWIGLLRKELYTYYLCGLTRGRCMLIVYGQWLIYLTVSAAAGAGAHRLSFPVLQYFEASVMPEWWAYLLLVGVLYLLSILCSLPEVLRVFTFHTKGEAV